MPVSIVVPDDLCDAIVERKGRTDVNVQDEEIFERLEDLIDNGVHFSAITYPNPPTDLDRAASPATANHYYFRSDNAATRTTKHGRMDL